MRTESLPRAKARVYLQKAEEFARAMDRATEAGDWNAAGLNAVHAVISGLDALTTFYLQERSRSPNHADALILANQIALPGARERVRQAEQVLKTKNQVEYEARSLKAEEAEGMRKKAERFLQWVRARVGGT